MNKNINKYIFIQRYCRERENRGVGGETSRKVNQWRWRKTEVSFEKESSYERCSLPRDLWLIIVVPQGKIRGSLSKRVGVMARFYAKFDQFFFLVRWEQRWANGPRSARERSSLFYSLVIKYPPLSNQAASTVALHVMSESKCTNQDSARWKRKGMAWLRPHDRNENFYGNSIILYLQLQE